MRYIRLVRNDQKDRQVRVTVTHDGPTPVPSYGGRGPKVRADQVALMAPVINSARTRVPSATRYSTKTYRVWWATYRSSQAMAA